MSVINKPKKTKSVKKKNPRLVPVSAVRVQQNVKEDAKAMLDRLPDGLTWEQVLYNFAVRTRVEAGLRDIAEGRYYTEEEANEIFDRWEKEWEQNV